MNLVEIYQASSPSILSLSGGGRYRGIYDTGFKRGFMGYIGLLLNAPYKIDSIVWMRLMWIYLNFSYLSSFCSGRLYEPEAPVREKDRKCAQPRFRKYPGFGHFGNLSRFWGVEFI
jgi:hypothetical protein